MEPPKKKEKAPKVAATAPNSDAAPIASDVDGKTGRKEKKEKKIDGAAADPTGKKASSKSAGTASEPTGPVPSMIDLRVGHIVDGAILMYQSPAKLTCCTVQKHPDADGLYVEVCHTRFISCRQSMQLSSKSILGRRPGLGQSFQALLIIYRSNRCETSDLSLLFVFPLHLTSSK